MATTQSRQDTQQNGTAAATISDAQLDALRNQFANHPTAQLMQNAVTQVTVHDVALSREVVNAADHTFSHVLDDWSVTNQKKSGRCWMFAGLNLFRVDAMQKMNVKDFEFSQNFTMFWDKFERSNYFLEAMIELAERDVDDRTVAWLLSRPLDDGGQWNMFVNIVDKYGLVPKAVMPETESSSNTSRMNATLVAKLREGAACIRAAHADGQSVEQLRSIKTDLLEAIYRIQAIHLGTPPDRFDWQWNDRDKQFHRDGEITPQEFAERYVSVPIHDYVCLVHDPRPTSPMGRTFTVDYLGNVAGGGRVVYLNVEIEQMKQVAMQTIVDGEPVWFGCDVVPMMRRDMGVWDAQLFDLERVYDTTFSLDKSQRLLHQQTMMTHAMLFTGVDVVEGRPRRWRVENSWGEEGGQKGFYLMNDSWFDEYMFEIAARRSYLTDEMQRALDEEPIVLPAWDPMGSLA